MKTIKKHKAFAFLGAVFMLLIAMLFTGCPGNAGGGQGISGGGTGGGTSPVEGVWRWISEQSQGQPLQMFPKDTGGGSQMQPYYCFWQGKMYHALKASGYPSGAPPANGIFQMPENWGTPYIFQGNMLMNFNVTFNGNEMTLEIPGQVTLKMEKVSDPTVDQILAAKPLSSTQP